LLIISGVIYDVIVEPPSIGSTTDEKGVSKPVCIILCMISVFKQLYHFKCTIYYIHGKKHRIKHFIDNICY